MSRCTGNWWSRIVCQRPRNTMGNMLPVCVCPRNTMGNVLPVCVCPSHLHHV